MHDVHTHIHTRWHTPNNMKCWSESDGVCTLKLQFAVHGISLSL